MSASEYVCKHCGSDDIVAEVTYRGTATAYGKILSEFCQSLLVDHAPVAISQGHRVRTDRPGSNEGDLAARSADAATSNNVTPLCCQKCGAPVQRSVAWRVELDADGHCPQCAWMEGADDDRD